MNIPKQGSVRKGSRFYLAPEISKLLKIYFNGEEQKGTVIHYNLDTQTITRYKLDDKGKPKISGNGQTLLLETVTGILEVRT